MTPEAREVSAPQEAAPCPNCGEAAMLEYCSRCGEKRREQSDWQLSKIAGEAISELTEIEHSKLWQTLRLLLFRPGQLTNDNWQGRRQRFIGPVKLYLIFFALSLVLYSVHQPTAVYDVRTLAAVNEEGKLARLLEQKAGEAGMSTDRFAEQVNSRWQRYVSLSQLVYPFFVAVALKLLYLRRPIYFTQHLVFALHVLAFTFLSLILLWPLYFAFGIKPSADHFTSSYVVLTSISALWTGSYLFLALRRTYNDRPVAATVTMVIVFLVYFATSMVFLSATFLLAIARSGS